MPAWVYFPLAFAARQCRRLGAPIVRRTAGPVFFVVVGLLAPGAPAKTAPAAGDRGRPQLPTIRLKLADKPFLLWVARTSAQQERGLMYIRHLPAKRGMIFVFSRSRPETFWMKHTWIPLDLLFLNKHGVIVGHCTMRPDHGRTLYPSPGPVRFAMELNAGICQRLGLKDGRKVILPARLVAPPTRHKRGL